MFLTNWQWDTKDTDSSSRLLHTGARACREREEVLRSGDDIAAHPARVAKRRGMVQIQFMTCALITGVSAGLGLEYAKLFAADGHDLILVARRRDRLEALAKELAQGRSLQVAVIDRDLSAPGGAAQVIAEVEAPRPRRRLPGQQRRVRHHRRLRRAAGRARAGGDRLNVAALVELTQAFLPGMLARKSGRVLNIGSTAGFRPARSWPSITPRRRS